MIQHFDEDTLLKYKLELLEHEELADVKNHLTICQTCKSKIDEITAEIDLMSSYDPEVEEVYSPVTKNRKNYSVWLKRAAVLLVGFVTGYSTSVYVQPDHVVVVGQYLNTAKANDVITDYTVCPSIDIYLMD